MRILFLFFIFIGVCFTQLTPYKQVFRTTSVYTGMTLFTGAQDKNKLMYFASTKGLLRFDGTEWQLVYASDYLIRSMDYDKNTHRMYLGLENDFGFVDLNTNTYTSLASKLKTPFRGYIWSTYVVGSKVYFASSFTIFVHNETALKTIRSKTSLSTLKNVGNRLVTNVAGKGLAYISGDSLKTFLGGELFASNKSPHFQMLQVNEQSFFILAPKDGLYLYKDKQIKKIDSELSKRSKDHFFYFSTKIDSNRYMFAENGKTYRIVNSEGQLIYSIENTESAFGLFTDSDGDVWSTQVNQVTHYQFSSPTHYLDKNLGYIFYTDYIKDHVVFLTQSGVYYLNTTTYSLKQEKRISGQLTNIKVVDGKLFILSDTGLYETTLKSVKHISKHRALKLFKSENNHLYIIGRNKATIVGKSSDGWKEIGRFSTNKRIIQHIVQNKKGQTLLSTLDGKLYTLSIVGNEATTEKIGFLPIDLNKGDLSLPEGKNTYIYINLFDNGFYIVQNDSVFKYSESENTFLVDRTLKSRFGETLSSIYEDNEHNLFLSKKPYTRKVFWVDKTTDRFQFDPFYENIIENRNSLTSFQNRYSVYGSDYNHLLALVDRAQIPKSPKPLHVYVNRIFANEDSVLFSSYKKKKTGSLDIESHLNTLTFSYATYRYSRTDAILYQYRLVNSSEENAEWSDWNKEHVVTFHKLDPGAYVFQVRAKDVYDTHSEIEDVAFRIERPWFLSSSMFVVYFLCFAGIVYGCTLFWNRRLIAKTKALECIVEERTLTISKQNEALQQTDRIKSTFFANVSHEFRTPLTLILSPTEQLLKSEQDAEKKQQLQTIHINGKRLLKHVNQLLDITKIDSGEITLNYTHISVDDLITRCIASFETFAKTKHISVRTSIQPIHFPCDIEKMDDVITNLLGNALKFTPEYGTIDLHLVQDEKNALHLTIKDSGIGIKKDEIDRIFDRYFQGSTDEIGTGIGLSLVKDFVELHGGTISVSSEEGKGATFKIYIPYKQLVVSDVKEPESIPVVSDNTPKAQRPLLLLVEDNTELASYISNALADRFRICIAKDVKEGLTLAKEKVPDIILSDVMMPKMDGIALTNEIKTHMLTAHVPLVLLTAKADIEDKLSGLRIGADDYIAKPFHLEELIVRLENLLENRNRLHEKYQKGDRSLSSKGEESSLSEIDRTFLENAKSLVDQHLSNSDYSPDQFCSDLAVSRTQLYRKLKALTGLSPTLFIRNHRLSRAADYLLEGEMNITEISIRVGFKNMSYFTRSFKEVYSIPPKEYAKQHQHV